MIRFHYNMQWTIFEYPKKHWTSEGQVCLITPPPSIPADTIALPMRHGLYLL